jgi:hypothetical protein
MLFHSLTFVWLWIQFNTTKWRTMFFWKLFLLHCLGSLGNAIINLQWADYFHTDPSWTTPPGMILFISQTKITSMKTYWLIIDGFIVVVNPMVHHSINWWQPLSSLSQYDLRWQTFRVIVLINIGLGYWLFVTWDCWYWSSGGKSNFSCMTEPTPSRTTWGSVTPSNYRLTPGYMAGISCRERTQG